MPYILEFSNHSRIVLCDSVNNKLENKILSHTTIPGGWYGKHQRYSAYNQIPLSKENGMLNAQKQFRMDMLWEKSLRYHIKSYSISKSRFMLHKFLKSCLIQSWFKIEHNQSDFIVSLEPSNGGILKLGPIFQ